MRRVPYWLLATLLLGLSATAHAQDDEFSDDEGALEGAEEAGWGGDDVDLEEPELGAPDQPGAVPGKAPNWFFGGQFRLLWVPAFMQKIFLDEAPNVANVAWNLQATMRKPDGFSLVMGLGYTPYSFTGPYLGKGDPDDEVEVVDSSLGVVHVTGSMLWGTEINENFTFEYGFGFDFGFVTGELRRTEGYPDANSDDGYSACRGVGQPDVFYCEPGPVAFDQDGAHYNVLEERVPPVVLLPMIPHLAFRFAPTPETAIKFELTYGIFQFWMGLSAAYGFDLS